MRVLLFGAGGMLATALSDAFHDAQLVQLRERDCDITDAGQVHEQVAEHQPELILNAAAFTDVDGCETKEALARRVNGEAVGYLGQAAKRIGATVVHFSTDYVFDGANVDGYAEDAVTAPINAYGRTKALGEQRLRESGANAYLIRTSWLYGPNGKNFVDTMLRLGREERTLKVVDDQRGSPTLTVDLAMATYTLVNSGAPFGTYHRTNDGVVTWFGFSQAIFELAGQPTTVEPVSTSAFPRPARRPAVSILRTTKLPPLRHWRDALAVYLTMNPQSV